MKVFQPMATQLSNESCVAIGWKTCNCILLMNETQLWISIIKKSFLTLTDLLDVLKGEAAFVTYEMNFCIHIFQLIFFYLKSIMTWDFMRLVVGVWTDCSLYFKFKLQELIICKIGRHVKQYCKISVGSTNNHDPTSPLACEIRLHIKPDIFVFDKQWRQARQGVWLIYSVYMQ